MYSEYEINILLLLLLLMTNLNYIVSLVQFKNRCMRGSVLFLNLMRWPDIIPKLSSFQKRYFKTLNYNIEVQ